MYYFPENLFLVSFQGCDYCIIRRCLERQRAAVSFLVAHFGLPQSRFGNLEDVACRAWAGTPVTGVRESFANGSLCHGTEIRFHSPVYWLRHCISAALEQRQKPKENDAFAVVQSRMTRAQPLALLCCVCSDLLTHAHAFAAHSNNAMSSGACTPL